VVFCSVAGSVLSRPVNRGGTSSTGLLAETKSPYPTASDYEYCVMPNGGHFWQFYLAARGY